MSKFKYIVDTRHFCSRSLVNGNKAEPVATIREIEGGAIIIFFADEVAAALKEWRPQAVIKKSNKTGRYYAIIDEACLPKDDPSKNFVQSSVHKAISDAGIVYYETPIREFRFALVEDAYSCDNLRIELRYVSGMAGKYTKYEQQKVTYYTTGQELTALTKLSIKKIIFNGPATIVMWSDGTKTIVKCQPGETPDKEKGVFAACAKRFLGTNKTGSNYLEQIKGYLEEK